MVLPARAVMSVKVPMFNGGIEVLRCVQSYSEGVEAKRVSRPCNMAKDLGGCGG